MDMLLVIFFCVMFPLLLISWVLSRTCDHVERIARALEKRNEAEK
jgi:hypothetical protein